MFEQFQVSHLLEQFLEEGLSFQRHFFCHLTKPCVAKGNFYFSSQTFCSQPQTSESSGPPPPHKHTPQVGVFVHLSIPSWGNDGAWDQPMDLPSVCNKADFGCCGEESMSEGNAVIQWSQSHETVDAKQFSFFSSSTSQGWFQMPFWEENGEDWELRISVLLFLFVLVILCVFRVFSSSLSALLLSPLIVSRWLLPCLSASVKCLGFCHLTWSVSHWGLRHWLLTISHFNGS